MLAILCSILLCTQAAKAGNAHAANRLERKTELLFDKREPPVPKLWLQERQEPSSSSTSAPTSTNGHPTIHTATPTSQANLPSPFDTSLGNNFTSPSCPAFFQNFLTNSTFRECLPFSLLLQTSNAFFSATRSPVELTQTLEATCNIPSYTQCSALMASLAQQIQGPSTCGNDLQMQNPMVLQAYNGFLAYQSLYHAGCLTDGEGNYCYANAVTNASAPTSSYVYYLPLGVQLPGGARPACNPCLQNTMSVFATYAGNSSQPLNSDYAAAAQQVDMTCGPRFVEAAVAKTSAAAMSMVRPAGLLFWSVLMTTMFAYMLF